MTFREKGLNIYLYPLLPLQKSLITLVKQTKQSNITKADRALTKTLLQNKISIEALWTKLLKSHKAAPDFKISHFRHVVQKTKPLCYVIKHL